MPRFQIQTEQIKDGVVSLSREESHHAIRVLRVKRGDAVELFDGKGKNFRGVAIGERHGILSLSIAENASQVPKQSRLSPVEITLAVSVIKPERMELLIEKACELGVHELSPVISERSVVRISRERWVSKIKRWRKIALASCKQCGRDRPPEIRDVRPFKNLDLASYDKLLIATLAFPGDLLYTVLKKEPAKKIGVLIGPEGDFTKNEVEWAISQGAQPVTLGPRILRSETAAISLLSMLDFYYREIQADANKN